MLYLYPGLCAPTFIILHLGMLNFMPQSFAHLDRLSSVFCRQSRSCMLFIIFSPLVSSANFLIISILVAALSMSSMKMSKSWGPRTEPCGTHSPHFDCLRPVCKPCFYPCKYMTSDSFCFHFRQQSLSQNLVECLCKI